MTGSEAGVVADIAAAELSAPSLLAAEPEALGDLVLVATIEVECPEVFEEDAALEHVVGGGEDRGGATATKAFFGPFAC